MRERKREREGEDKRVCERGRDSETERLGDRDRDIVRERSDRETETAGQTGQRGERGCGAEKEGERVAHKRDKRDIM